MAVALSADSAVARTIALAAMRWVRVNIDADAVAAHETGATRAATILANLVYATRAVANAAMCRVEIRPRASILFSTRLVGRITRTGAAPADSDRWIARVVTFTAMIVIGVEVDRYAIAGRRERPKIGAEVRCVRRIGRVRRVRDINGHVGSWEVWRNIQRDVERVHPIRRGVLFKTKVG